MANRPYQCHTNEPSVRACVTGQTQEAEWIAPPTFDCPILPTIREIGQAPHRDAKVTGALS